MARLMPYIDGFVDDMQRVVGDAVEFGFRERAISTWQVTSRMEETKWKERDPHIYQKGRNQRTPFPGTLHLVGIGHRRKHTL